MPEPRTKFADLVSQAEYRQRRADREQTVASLRHENTHLHRVNGLLWREVRRMRSFVYLAALCILFIAVALAGLVRSGACFGGGR